MHILKSSVRLLTIATLGLTLSGLVSCNKDNGEVVYEEAEKFETQSCYNHSLKHFAAVAPTANTGGNIEYWYCENCGKYYSDANGANAIPTPFLRSGNRAKGPELLKKYPAVFEWSNVYGNGTPSESQTKGLLRAPAALGGVQIGVGMVSCVLTATNIIQTLLNDDDEQEKFDQIMDGIEKIEEDVNEVKRNTNNILIELEDAPYQNQIGKKVTLLKNVWDEALLALGSMDGYLKDYEAGIITEDVANKYITNTVKDWSERKPGDGESSYDMIPTVEQLLKDFSGISLGNGKFETFPEIAREHVQTYIAFDHLGYGQRASLMRYYQFSLAPAYYLYKLYRGNVDEMKKTDPGYWEAICAKSEEEFININDLIKKDSTNMNLAYEHYRVFRPNLSNRGLVRYYKPEVIGPFNFSKWIDSHYWSNQQPHAWFPGDNYDNRFETNTTKMWNEVTGIEGDHEYLYNNLGYLANHPDYVDIYSEYPDSSLYNVLKYEGCFIGSHLYKEPVSMDGGNYEFHYFHWWPRETQIISSKGSIRTVLSGETGYYITSFDNRWMCFKIVCDDHSGATDYVNFGMESSRKENGDCENIVFYENVPIQAEMYNKYDATDQRDFGAIKTPSDKGKNTKHCFGILEHYDTTVNEVYE